VISLLNEQILISHSVKQAQSHPTMKWLINELQNAHVCTCYTAKITLDLNSIWRTDILIHLLKFHNTCQNTENKVHKTFPQWTTVRKNLFDCSFFLYKVWQPKCHLIIFRLFFQQFFLVFILWGNFHILIIAKPGNQVFIWVIITSWTKIIIIISPLSMDFQDSDIFWLSIVS
jgi:hypothetical protein